MKFQSSVVAISLGLALFGGQVSTASAALIEHEDPGNSFRTVRFAADAPVGRLTVSSAQTSRDSASMLI